MADLQPPAVLGRAGKAAWRRACATLTEPEQRAARDLIEAYAGEVQILAELRAAWAKEGRPTLTIGQRGAPITHPLLSAMRMHDLAVSQLSRSLKLAPAAPRSVHGRMGRPVGAVSAPDRVASRDMTVSRRPSGEPARVTLLQGGAS